MYLTRVPATHFEASAQLLFSDWPLIRFPTVFLFPDREKYTVAFCHWKVRIHLFFVHPLKKNNRNKLSSIVLLSGCSKISGFALFSANFKWQRATVRVMMFRSGAAAEVSLDWGWDQWLFVSRNDWPRSDWEKIFGSVEAAKGIKINGSESFNNSLGFNQWFLMGNGAATAGRRPARV